MESITILNTIPVYALTDISVICAFAGVILGFIFFVIYYFLTEKRRNNLINICEIISVLLAMGSCALFLAAIMSFPKKLCYYKYEVLIDEEVNLVDFYEKYDIIEKKNEIYVIREKEE